MTKTLLHSIFDNNRDCKIGIHVLHSALDEDDLSALDKTVKSYGGELFSYKISADRDTDTIVKKTRLPKEAYYRLLCMDCLPDALDRVLYLDCDIIVNGSLKALYNTDLTGYMFAAADDYVEVIGKSSKPTTEQRAVIDQYIPKDCKYVNSGVLLMNLELLRKAITTDEIISMIEEFGDQLVWHDQDFINYVFYEHILHIDYRLYNYFPVYYVWGDVTPGKPAIIHFAGFFKPWKDDYFARCEPFVEAYQNTTRRFVKQAKELYEKYAAME
jgi:lipopolysaccharide biosynthesis glycosyltransferase